MKNLQHYCAKSGKTVRAQSFISLINPNSQVFEHMKGFGWHAYVGEKEHCDSLGESTDPEGGFSAPALSTDWLSLFGGCP